MHLSLLSVAPTALLKLQLLTLLIQLFKYRVIDTNKFSLIINAEHIHYSIVCYGRDIEFCITIMSRLYYCCVLFVNLLLFTIILRSNFMIIIALDKDIINITFFNHCD